MSKRIRILSIVKMQKNAYFSAVQLFDYLPREFAGTVVLCEGKESLQILAVISANGSNSL